MRSAAILGVILLTSFISPALASGTPGKLSQVRAAIAWEAQIITTRISDYRSAKREFKTLLAREPASVRKDFRMARFKAVMGTAVKGLSVAYLAERTYAGEPLGMVVGAGPAVFSHLFSEIGNAQIDAIRHNVVKRAHEAGLLSPGHLALFQRTGFAGSMK